MSLASLNRREVFKQFKEKEYDLLIIGGGITGAGIALDAANRGIKVALVEKDDFAFGTSSRSTKLIHGGLRYLKNFQWKIVSEIGKERTIVYKNGPHITHREPMLLPIYRGGGLGRFSTSIGLRLYDRLAKVKPDEKRVMLNSKKVLAKVPHLKKEGLRGGGYYTEYRTDDARLTIEILKRAYELGADIINYAEVIDFNYTSEGKVEGAILKDHDTENTYLIEAKVVVNATGAWVEKTDKIANPNLKEEKLLLSKGIHLVFDAKRLPIEQSLYFDVKTDKRMIFVIPREDKVYVGTTESIYQDDLNLPPITTVDRSYLLYALNSLFPDINLTEEDIESSWAGIRPLIKEENKPSTEISRKDDIWETPSGMLTIAGGKLTGYRLMAQKVLEKITVKLKEDYQLDYSFIDTIDVPYSGGEIEANSFSAFLDTQAKEATKYNLTEEEGRWLARHYGSNVMKLFRIAQKVAPQEKEEIPLLLYIALRYGLEEEAVLTPTDFFVRRTGLLYFNIKEVIAHKKAVLKYMASYFNWNKKRTTKEATRLLEALYYATHAVEESEKIQLDFSQEKDRSQFEKQLQLQYNNSVSSQSESDKNAVF